MKAEKRTLSTKVYALIIIGVLVGAVIGFGLGAAVYVPQINSLNSKAKLQSSLVTLASYSPFAVGAAGTLAGAFGSVLTAFENQYPSIKVAPPIFEGSDLVASTENLTEQFSLEAAADTTAIQTLFPHIANYEIAFGQTQMVVIVNLQSSLGTELYNLWKSAQSLTAMSLQWNQTWTKMFTLIAFNSSSSARVGISNPFTDPSGYQAAGMIRLAGLTFFGNMSKLYDAIYDNASRYYMQNTESDLVPLVQTDNIAFIISAYKSNAIPQTGNSTQTGLAYITLPTAVNLGVLSDLSYYNLANFSL